MTYQNRSRRVVIAIALAVSFSICSWATAQSSQGKTGRDQLKQPVYQVPNKNKIQLVQAQALQHPLTRPIALSKRALVAIQNIKDYSCILIKRENIKGVLGDPQKIFVKIRHNPFSVYMYFLDPVSVKGREVIYQEGRYDNKLVAHQSGLLRFKTWHLDPDGALAMRGQRYPITEIGIRNLCVKLIEVAEKDRQFRECKVKYFKDAKINGRQCMCIQVVHPKRRKNFRFYIARIYIDKEWNIPIRFSAWEWPKKPNGNAVLQEQYTYTQLKLNNNFTDKDFDITNPNYNYSEGRKAREARKKKAGERR